MFQIFFLLSLGLTTITYSDKNYLIETNPVKSKIKNFLIAFNTANREENLSALSDEARLRFTILKSYDASLRPVINISTPTLVSVSLWNLQVIGLDEPNQIMITTAQVVLKWKDEYLKWDPQEFSNITRIILSAKDLWTPDIVLFNSADVAYSSHREMYLLDVDPNGTVTWMFPDILRSYCGVDIKYFPFDKQSCVLEFQSWSRDRNELIVYHGTDNVFLNHTHINTEWMKIGMTVFEKEDNKIVYLEFKIILKRNYAFYVNHMIIPFTILSSLTLFVFWLPPDSGEKITLIVTILLTLTVFLQFITEYTPKSSKSLPLIGIYFNFNLTLVLISVVLTIIILTFHFRGPKTQRVPNWLRTFAIGYLGRIFCFISYEENLSNSKTSRTKHVIKIDELLNQSFDITLIKLLNSFEPCQLRNSKLKCLILKEILACQLNLIKQKSEFQKRKADIKLKEIYDEWKIVAMLMDRTCFFLYLSGFVATGLLYLYFM